ISVSTAVSLKFCITRLRTQSSRIFKMIQNDRMATFGYVEYEAASPAVKAVYDDIMRTRNIDWINNFWKALAHDPALLKRTWESVKEVMAPGTEIDPLTKE